MAGSLNSDSVIWVVGDTTGKDIYGETVAIPDNETDTLEAKLAASGILFS